MVDLKTRTEPDRTTRSAALWATAIAVPVAVLVGILIFAQVARTAVEPGPAAAPVASTSAAPVPSAAVPMAAPRLSERAAQVCLAVTSQLPNQVRNLVARKVSAGPEQNAAWGEPPLTVACGVARPVLCETLDGGTGCVPLDAELLNMNRVCWYAEAKPGGTAFTTMDREVPVQVTVPSQYEQAAQWANEFSDVVVQTDKSVTKGVPSGCL